MVFNTQHNGEDKPPQDLFGYYCSIEMKRHGVPNEMYQHKVIGRFNSNTWVDVPIQSPATAVWHDSVQEVVNVICCGVVEEQVYRVRLQDVKDLHSHAYKKGFIDGQLAGK